MALTKDKKAEVVKEIAELLGNSKLTVAAKYPGTSVKQLQTLRREARDGGTNIRVVKNRLFKKALEAAGHNEAAKTMPLTGQLMYVFNSEDEVAPAQVVANFSKVNPKATIVTGINAAGEVLPAEDLTVLASLPSKDQLRGMLVATIAAPINNFAGVLAGVNRSVLNVLNARAEQVS